METMQLAKLLGIPVQSTPWKKKEQLPNYLTYGRIFDTISVGQSTFLMITLSLDGRFNIRQLSNQIQKISEAAHMPVALNISHISPYQRRALIQYGISFVMPPDQIYLPFLGVALKKHAFKEEKQLPVKFQPATQQVFLYLFYHQRNSLITKSDLAEQLSLTKTSITRAVEQLNSFGILERMASPRSPVRLNTAADLKKFIAETLIDPVQQRILIHRQDLPQSALLAGESCLSEYTMLNPPRMPAYACSKKAASLKTLKPVDPLWEDTTGCVLLELWKYPPQLFASDGKVDRISLYCSLKTNSDERIQGESEKLLEIIKW